MTSRERVFAALSHQQPDRVPVDFWGTPEVVEKLMRHFAVDTLDALLDILEVDMQQLRPRPLDPATEVFEDGSYYDERGIRVKPVKNDYCTYMEFVGASLGDAETVEDLAAFPRWQNADNYDWADFAEQARKASEKRVVRLSTGGIFETAIALRGYEQFLMDLVLQPEIPEYIMNRITDFLCDFVTRAMEAAGEYVDIIYTYDDIATQQDLLISHDMLERFVYPCHRRYNAHIKTFGKKIMYHSCGAVASEIDSLAALPIDILNPLQPLAKGMDLAAIKAKHGERLCFHGAICIQELLPKGTPAEIRETVKNTVATLGKGGGYIMASAHYIQNDTSVENILALYDTAIR